MRRNIVRTSRDLREKFRFSEYDTDSNVEFQENGRVIHTHQN